jgi:hypothetical protein
MILRMLELLLHTRMIYTASASRGETDNISLASHPRGSDLSIDLSTIDLSRRTGRMDGMELVVLAAAICFVDCYCFDGLIRCLP